jgi:hypothetical protein
MASNLVAYKYIIIYHLNMITSIVISYSSEFCSERPPFLPCHGTVGGTLFERT